MTALCAQRLAHFNHGHAGEAAVAGLLHRAGEAQVLMVCANTEMAEGFVLSAPSRQRLSAAHAELLTAALLEKWQLPARVRHAALVWRHCGGEVHANAEAAAVYLGHLLAAELLHPQFCLVERAAEIGESLGFSRASLQDVRAAAPQLRQMLALIACELAAPRDP